MTVEPIDLVARRQRRGVTPLRAFVWSSAVAVLMVTVALRNPGAPAPSAGTTGTTVPAFSYESSRHDTSPAARDDDPAF